MFLKNRLSSSLGNVTRVFCVATTILISVVWASTSQAVVFNLTYAPNPANVCFDDEGVSQTATVNIGDIPAGSVLNSFSYTVVIDTSDDLTDVSLIATRPGGANVLTIASFSPDVPAGSVATESGTIVIGGSPTPFGSYGLTWDDNDDNGTAGPGTCNGTNFDNRIVSVDIEIDFTPPALLEATVDLTADSDGDLSFSDSEAIPSDIPTAVDFNFVVSNTSATDALSIGALLDDIAGVDVRTLGGTCGGVANPAVLGVVGSGSETLSCTYQQSVTLSPLASQSRTVTATMTQGSVVDEDLADSTSIFTTRPEPIQVYYLPYPEDELFESYDTLIDNNTTCTDTSVDTPMTTIIGISVLQDNTFIYVDHWEDNVGQDIANNITGAYEADVLNPAQGSTEIWGDGDRSNGFVPGTSTDAEDRLDRGDYIEIDNDVDPSTAADLQIVDYDGHDKFASSSIISITRAGWAQDSETLLAGAWEVYDTSNWGRDYELPIGEDMSIAPLNRTEFEFVSASVMASRDGTVVSIDPDGDGPLVEFDVNLDEGDSFHINGDNGTTAGLHLGATIKSTRDVQVHLNTGEVCSGFQSRSMTLFPVEDWTNVYYSPVDSDAAADPTNVWLYNPSETDTITIDVSLQAGNADPPNITLSPGEVEAFVMPIGSDDGDGGTIDNGPNDTGAQFNSVGEEPFYALATYVDDTSHDWGFTLVPGNVLSQQVFVGLGIGQDPDEALTENGSPVWITAARLDGNAADDGDITVCVDFNTDGDQTNGGANVFTFPGGSGATLEYDIQLDLSVLQRFKVYDPDGLADDTAQSGMLIFVCDLDADDAAQGVIAAAWGEDAREASGGSPGLDAGTGVPNVRSFITSKRSAFSTDIANDGEADIGDRITYTVDVINTGFIPLLEINLDDTLPNELAYVHGTTTFFDVDTHNPAISIADDLIESTTFPLDEGGINLIDLTPASVLGVGEKVTFTYETVVIATPFTADELCNTATGSTDTDSVDSEICVDQDNDETPGSITGTVWLDVDGDGVLDIGEPGIADVTVYLCGYIDEVGPPVVQQTACDANNAIATSITDANGDYDFDQLAAGSYQTAVEQTEEDPGNELENLTEAPGNIGGLSGEIILPEGGTEEADFGYVPETDGNGIETAVVEGTVWADYDEDGIQDPGEVGIPGITVFLEDGLCTPGTDCPSVVTQEDGSYLFTDIQFTGSQIEGGREFFVGVDITDAELISFCTPETVVDYTADDCATNNPIGNSVNSTPFTVFPSDVIRDVDFGFDPDSGATGANNTLTDRIWYDSDADGVQDAGEPGIEGVTVNLLDSAGSVIATTTNDANGDFTFFGLANSGSDDFTVMISDNAGVLNLFSETTSTDGDQDITDIDGDIDNNSPGANGGAPVLTGNGTGSPSFGYVLAQSVAGTVYVDSDANGDLNAPDIGLGGILVQLDNGACTLGSGGDCPSTTTNPDGSYLFTGVPTGTFTVVVNPNVGGVGQPPVGTEAEDPDGGADNQASVTVVTGQAVTGLDFGYVDDTLPDISGTVFLDVDTDGTFEPDGNDRTPGNADDESGIAGVTIELRDNSGGVVATTTTDANGDYSFEDVPIVDLDTNTTDYVVAVTDVANVLDGFDLTSALDQLPVDSSNGDVEDVDFGYANDETSAAITSGVWLDTDGDGVRDLDEPVLSEVTIDLFIDRDGDGVLTGADGPAVATAETDAQGNLIFPDLEPGTYFLDIDETDPDLPADYAEISNYSPLFNNPNATILLSEGELYDADFGYTTDPAEAAVTGIVWADEDENGVIDSSEARLAGIMVFLRQDTTGDGDFDTTLTTTTAADGSYEFTGLTPCPDANPCFSVTYDIDQVNDLELNGNEPTNTPDQNNADPTNPDPDGLNDTNYLFSLAPGEFGEDYNFGFDLDPTGSVGSFAEIEGYVYFEPTAGIPDGDFDSTLLAGVSQGPDFGIEEVTLNLLDDLGNIVATTVVGDGTTDANGDGIVDDADVGYYNFTGLLAGDYTVEVSDTANALINFNPSGDPDELGGVCTVCDESTTVSVTDAVVSNVDFGYIGEQILGNIGSLVWFDAVNDGIFNPDDGDVGIEGVTVECWFDTNGDADFGVAGANDFTFDGIDNLIRTVKTDKNGEYFCEGLPTGNYFVRVTDETEQINSDFVGAVVDTGNTGAPTDNDQTNKVDITSDHAWYIQTGSDNLTADFAVAGDNNLSISGIVFIEDSNLNPAEDGNANLIEVGEVDATYDDNDTDEPAPDVTVLLLRENAQGDFVTFLSTVTDSNGDYSFTSLPPGNYQVLVNPTGSVIETFGQTADPSIGSGVGIGGNANTVCDSPTAAACDDASDTIVLTNAAVSGVNFGYQDGFTTTPVAVNRFSAMGSNGVVEFTWETSNEVGHLGFQIYARVADGWQLLTQDLIVNNDNLGALATRNYQFTASVDATWFALVDVSVAEELTVHGPYRLNQEYGAALEKIKRPDWGSLKLEQPNMEQAAARMQEKLDELEEQATEGDEQIELDGPEDADLEIE